MLRVSCLPQPEHVFCSVPVDVQVAFFVTTQLPKLWPVAEIVSVFVVLHLVHVYVFTPASVQVAFLVTVPLPKL